MQCIPRVAMSSYPLKPFSCKNGALTSDNDTNQIYMNDYGGNNVSYIEDVNQQETDLPSRTLSSDETSFETQDSHDMQNGV